MANIDVIAAHYDASDRGDLEGMLAPLTPETRWTEAAGFPYAGTYVGPDAVRKNVFEAIAADWEGFTFTVAELLDAGDTVIALGNYSATNRASRRPFTARVAHVWKFADGQVSSFEQIVDSATVATAID